jgi:hypothetical protein
MPQLILTNRSLLFFLAVVAVVAADSYGHGGYGKQTTDWVVRDYFFNFLTFHQN